MSKEIKVNIKLFLEGLKMKNEKFYLDVENFSFEIPQNEEGDFLIKGFAINPGEKIKGVYKIEDSEFGNVQKTLLNKPILIDHANETNSAVGKVTFSDVRENPKTKRLGVYFEGFVDKEETSIIRKISKGILTAVSLGFSFDGKCSICGEDYQKCDHWFTNEDFQIIPRNMKAHELSLIPVPADKNASVADRASDLFSEDLIKFKEKKSMADNYEAKFSELSEKFANTVETHKTEIAELKESYDQKIQEVKDGYEEKFAEKLGELKTLESDLEQRKAELSEVTAKCDELEAELKKIEDAKLEAFRDEVFSLSEQVKGGLTREEIGEFSESVLAKYQEVFNNIIKAQPNIKPSVEKGEHFYKNNQESFEDADVVGKLLMRIN